MTFILRNGLREIYTVTLKEALLSVTLRHEEKKCAITTELVPPLASAVVNLTLGAQTTLVFIPL